MTKNEILAAQNPGFVHRYSVRFQDIDAAGIAYFPTIISFLHDAYVAFLEEAGVDLAALVRAGDYALPLRHAEADFLRPIRFGEKLEIELVRRMDGPQEVTLYYRVTGSGEAKAVGSTVHVFVDRRTFQRTEPPAALRRALDRIPAVA